MNLPAENIDVSLTITREFDASPETLFQAWTDPKQMTQWFAPAGGTTIAAHVDLKAGGRYRLIMQEPDGTTHTPHGEYREIDPPRLLVFTWILDGSGCEGSQGEFAETIVTVAFQAVGSGTRLVLTHDFLPSEKSKSAHHMGWEACLDSLAGTVP